MANDNRRHGALRDMFDFQSRGTTSDGWGNSVPGASFETRFRAFVNLRAKTGGEDVTALRMKGVQPYVVTARWSEEMLDVSVSWQLVDARAPGRNRVLNVVSMPVDPDGKRQWLEFLVTEGKAA